MCPKLYKDHEVYFQAQMHFYISKLQFNEFIFLTVHLFLTSRSAIGPKWTLWTSYRNALLIHLSDNRAAGLCRSTDASLTSGTHIHIQRFTRLKAPCGLGSCRISPPRFLAECGKSPLNQGSFVVLYFVLFNFSVLYLVTVACHLSF